MNCTLCLDILSTAVLLKDITLAMVNCKYVASALHNIAALNLSGAVGKGLWEKVVMDYFLEEIVPC
jgi:hypothetical protein